MMQSENRIFDDLAKMLNGVAGTVAGMGREAQENAKTRAREWAGGLDLVTREEFDAVKQLAANARAEAELLAERVEKLEAALNIKVKTAAKPTAKPAAKPAVAKPKAAPKASAKTTTKAPKAK
jgi:BMFP domain-containing protein YqiC